MVEAAGGAGRNLGLYYQDGDAVLLGIADRLIETLCCRDMPVWTGEAEFAACLSGARLREAIEVTTRPRQAMTTEPFDTPAGPLAVRIRIGAAGRHRPAIRAW